MVNIGDKVLVNLEKLGIADKEMEVIGVNDPQYLPYVGEHIIAICEGENPTVARTGEYGLVKSVKKQDDIGIADLIIPKEKAKGTKRIFYPVVEKHDGGVSYINDYGFKVTTKRYKKVDTDDVLNYIYDLQNQIHEIRTVTVEALRLVADDIKISLDKLEN